MQDEIEVIQNPKHSWNNREQFAEIKESVDEESKDARWDDGFIFVFSVRIAVWRTSGV